MGVAFGSVVILIRFVASHQKEEKTFPGIKVTDNISLEKMHLDISQIFWERLKKLWFEQRINTIQNCQDKSVLNDLSHYIKSQRKPKSLRELLFQRKQPALSSVLRWQPALF